MFCLLILLLFLFPLLCFEKTLTWGEEDRWARLFRLDNLQIMPGYRGYLDITLQDGEYHRDSTTDLLLHFNQEPILPPSRSYRIIQSGEDGGGFVTTVEKVLGSGSAAFTALTQGLEWEPGSDTLLGAGAAPGDFTLEFWLYPTRMSDGNGVFAWMGRQAVGGKQRDQGFYGEFFNQKLRWQFSNFFQAGGDEPTLFTLTGLAPLLPHRWNHHLLRYDSHIGLLEYLVNGEVEGIIHTTPTGKESAEVWTPLCGDAQPTRMVLGRGFLGLVEELRLSRRFVTKPQLTQFTLERGRAWTEVVDLEQPGTRFLGITAEETLRGNSAITYAYRQSEAPFRADDLEPSWKSLSPGESLPRNSLGRYLQMKIVLMPDGSGHRAPRLSSMELHYDVPSLPLPPTNFRVEPGDRSVTLRWNKLGNATAQGVPAPFRH